MASEHVGDLPPVTADDVQEKLEGDPSHVGYVVAAEESSTAWQAAQVLIGTGGGVPRLWIYRANDVSKLDRWVSGAAVGVAFGLGGTPTRLVELSEAESPRAMRRIFAELLQNEAP